MNRVLYLFFTATLAIPCAAQTYSKCNEVIGSAGFSATKNGNTWEATVGEAIIFTFSLPNRGRTLTQGFHQPDLCLTVSTDSDAEWAEWGIEVFPNPVSHILNIRFSGEKTGALLAQIFDPLGRLVRVDLPPVQSEGIAVDCGSWQPGIYALRLRDPQTNAVTAIRFIKF